MAGVTSFTDWSTVKGALSKFTRFRPCLGPLVTIVVLYGPCLFNLLIKFVSTRLQSLK